MKDIIYIQYYGPNPEEKWYIRLGTFLDFIEKNLIYYATTINGDKSAILKFNTDIERNLIYIEDLQISVDPDVCVINKTLNINDIPYYFTPNDAYSFISDKFDSYKCYGKIMNIYVNMKYILLELNRLKDAKTNKVVLIDFLNTILSSISRSLGSINNLEATIDENTNTVIIRDANPLPNIDYVIKKLNDLPGEKMSTGNVIFYLYGYSGSNAGFIKDFTFTTELSPAFSTMITVGATANSTVVGENSTALSRLNWGYVDRFKKNIDYINEATGPLVEQLSTLQNSNNPEVYNNLISDLEIKIENELVKNNLNQKYSYIFDNLTEYIKNLSINSNSPKYNIDEPNTYSNSLKDLITYRQQLREVQLNYIKFNFKTNPEDMPFAASTGFIPFNMSITMDGLSGMKIYNKFNIDSRYLPQNYTDNCEFLIKNIEHYIENNKWTTKLESIIISKGKSITTDNNTIPSQGGGQSTSPASSSPQTPVQESIDADFWSLVAISAAENFINNFQGMADVAQSIYNRLSAKVYGKSIKSIVVAPGQYEPTFRNPNDWRAIKDKETAITAYKNSRGISLEVATQTINNCVSALTSPLLKQNAKIFVGSRTEFLSAPPTSKDAVGVVVREPKNKNNAFFWNYSGKTLFYNKKIFTAQNPPSNLPQLT